MVVLLVLLDYLKNNKHYCLDWGINSIVFDLGIKQQKDN